MTVQDLVREALEEIGVDSPLDQQGGTDYDLGLRRFNALLDEWNADGLMLFNIAEETFTLPSSVSSRTIGPTGQFVTTRPLKVESAAMLNTSLTPNARGSMDVIDREAWESLMVRNVDGVPTAVYYEPTPTNGTLHFYTRSNGTYGSVVLSLLQQFVQATGLSTPLTLPPGYFRPTFKMLALDLCNPFGVTPAPLLVEQARQGKEKIRDLNREAPPRISTAPYSSDNVSGSSQNDFLTRNY